MEILKYSRTSFSVLSGMMIQKCSRTIFLHQNLSTRPVIMCIKMSQFSKNVQVTLKLSKITLVRSVSLSILMMKIWLRMNSVKSLLSELLRFCILISMNKAHHISYLTCKIINWMTRLTYFNQEIQMKQNSLDQLKELLKISRFFTVAGRTFQQNINSSVFLSN